MWWVFFLFPGTVLYTTYILGVISPNAKQRRMEMFCDYPAGVTLPIAKAAKGDPAMSYRNPHSGIDSVYVGCESKHW